MDTNNSLNGSATVPNISQASTSGEFTVRSVLTKLLQEHNLTITFTKKDGTERVMRCTLQDGVAIPYEKKTERTRDGNIDILPVWDIEANGWRSVTISTIKEFIVA